MAKKAWSNILATTISNCWDHTSIQCAPIIMHVPKVIGSAENHTWKIIYGFALDNIVMIWSLPSH